MDILALIVHDVMTADPVTVPVDMPVLDAVRVMKDTNCRHVPVMDDGRVVGLISTKDMSVQPFADRRVRDVMSRDMLTVVPRERIEVAATIMEECKVNSLLVLEHQRLAGIVTSYDLLHALAERLRAAREKAAQRLEQREAGAPQLESLLVEEGSVSEAQL